jgi:beta-glucosidase
MSTDESTDAEQEDLRFPEGFLWGAATAAHQVEGGNVRNDWWAFEHDPGSGCAEPSGDACDSWHRWSEDIELVASMGLGAYRFSLEWSRIEPEPGEWSRASLEHYRRMCAACLEHDVVPVVTFHHFTSPLWFARQGGWESHDAPDLFARFVERTAGALGDVVGWACTFNEPNVVAVLGYMQGTSPPGVQDLARYDTVNHNLARAHRRGVEALRSAPGTFPVGLTLSMDDMEAEEGGEGILRAAQQMLEEVFFEATPGDDFIGVQAYTRMRFGPAGELGPEPGVRLTQMGTEYWPVAVERTVRRAAAATGLPVLITESGIATADDQERIDYLQEALIGVGRCLADGVDVGGYFVWSLLDNFEWNRGYAMTFGLVEVDRATFERRPKPSASWFGGVARANALRRMGS